MMEYLDGCTLAEIVSEEGALPIAWVVDILEQVCAAVEEAHRAGIIHRDLKPDNIWLEPNGRGGYTVKVLDFGLVKLGDADEVSRGSSASIRGNMSGPSALYQLLNVFVTPVTAIMASLLYLKTRKAGGKSLSDASEQFDALDIPEQMAGAHEKPSDHHAPANHRSEGIG